MTIIKKFEVEKEKKGLPKKAYLVGVFLIALIVAEIWVSHSLAIQGEDLEKMENLKKVISSENQLITAEIAKYSAISNIASKSANLGLIKPKNIQYIR